MQCSKGTGLLVVLEKTNIIVYIGFRLNLQGFIFRIPHKRTWRWRKHKIFHWPGNTNLLLLCPSYPVSELNCVRYLQIDNKIYIYSISQIKNSIPDCKCTMAEYFLLIKVRIQNYYRIAMLIELITEYLPWLIEG